MSAQASKGLSKKFIEIKERLEKEPHVQFARSQQGYDELARRIFREPAELRAVGKQTQRAGS